MCVNNPCGCASEIELPYITGAAGANGTNGTNGTNGVGITSIDSAIVGDTVTLTINYTNSTTEDVTFNIPSKAYVLESNIADPALAILNTGFLGDVTQSALTLPISELSAVGDVAQIEYVFTCSGASADEIVLFQVNDTTILSTKLNEGKGIFRAEFTRISATKLHYTVSWEERGLTSEKNSDVIDQGFISVTSMDTNTVVFEVEIGVAIASSVTINLVKAQSKIIKI